MAVEAMALRRFMVVIYNVRPLIRVLLKALVRTPYISIPNCLTEAPVYPELLCGDAVPERIVRELRRRKSRCRFLHRQPMRTQSAAKPASE